MREEKGGEDMSKAMAFGEAVEGYDVPVLNEREIRASAGILFLVLFSSWMQILFRHNFIPIKYGICVFIVDFIIRVFVNPEFSPTLILGRYIVRRQRPEYVGAAPKKFAWIIGFALSTAMFLHMVVLNSYSFITGLICIVCLTFLFFESAFGICLGCLFYGLFHKEEPRYCPGDACDAKAKRAIRRISFAQMAVVLGLVMCLILASSLFGGYLSAQPRELRALLHGL
jgi:hypothetical protein